MADLSQISILLFLFTLLFSGQINGRESQFFNKIPSNNNVAPLSAQNQPDHVDPLTKPAAAEQEPTFIHENENGGYGLYGRESDHISPTTTTTSNNKFNNPTTTTENNDPNGFLPKYLPKNYNTVAYVTQPEGYTQPKATSNNYYSAEDAVNVQDQSQGYSASSGNNGYTDRSYHYPTNYNANGYNSQSQQQSVDQFKLDQKSNYNTNTDNSNYYNSHSNSNVEKQGMSDTRFMENGRYFYDINSEGNSRTYTNNNNNGGYNSRTYGDEYNNKIGGYNSPTFGDQYQYNNNNNNNNNGGYSYGRNDANSYDLNTFPNQGRFESQDEEQFQDFQNQRALP